MANKQHVPGTIPAVNTETGVKLRVRQDMLDNPYNTLKLKEITEEEFLSDKSFKVVKKTTETLTETGEVTAGDSGDSDIIMTSTNEPFKSEASAKAKFTKEGLSEEDWMVLPVDGGFVITKI